MKNQDAEKEFWFFTEALKILMDMPENYSDTYYLYERVCRHLAYNNQKPMPYESFDNLLASDDAVVSETILKNEDSVFLTEKGLLLAKLFNDISNFKALCKLHKQAYEKAYPSVRLALLKGKTNGLSVLISVEAEINLRKKQEFYKKLLSARLKASQLLGSVLAA